jgi:hypothetical protein
MKKDSKKICVSVGLVTSYKKKMEEKENIFDRKSQPKFFFITSKLLILNLKLFKTIEKNHI